MHFKLLSITFLLALLSWTGCKKDEEVTPTPTPVAHEITPGVGITEVKIGDAAQVAIDLFGVPFPANVSVNGVYTHYLTYVSKGAVVYCEPTTTSTFNAQMKIARLKFTSPFDGKTSKGIGIGSTKAAVKTAYGDPSSSSPSSGDSYTIGVIFIYDAGDLVKSIEVK